MDPDPASSLIIIVLSLFASAFFSGMEIAYVSANRLQIELDAKSTWQGKILTHLADRPQLFIATMLVGNNLALVFCGLESGALISNSIFQVSDWTVAPNPFTVLATQTALTTAVILVLAEFIPKALFHANANFWLKFFCSAACDHTLPLSDSRLHRGRFEPNFNSNDGEICKINRYIAGATRSD
jgi:CBS domain containing-hemolysin-like protein